MQHETQTIVDFLDYLKSAFGYRLCYAEENPNGGFEDWRVVNTSADDLVAEWAGIDLEKLNTERRTVLTKIKSLQK